MSNDGGRTLTSQEKKRTIRRIVVQLVVAILILVPAILLCLHWKTLIIQRVLKAVELIPQSEGFSTWLNPPTSITRGYHLFNISNPTDIVTDPSSTTIRLTETPAYSYVLSATKEDVRWGEGDAKLSYSIHRSFTRHPTRFNPSSINDTGVFVDMLRATFRSQFGPKPSPSFFELGGTETFYHRNAVEQLEGFTSDLFRAMQDKMVGPNREKYGYVYRQNGSRLYNMTIRTGKAIIRTFLRQLNLTDRRSF